MINKVFLILLAAISIAISGCGYFFPEPPACVNATAAVQARRNAKMLPVDTSLMCYRCYEMDGMTTAVFKSEKEPDRIMKTANCKNGKVTVEVDRFSSGRQYYPKGYVSGGRDDGPSFEYLDHYLIYDETEAEGTICNGKPKGDYWFHNGREIPESEAKEKLKEWELQQE